MQAKEERRNLHDKKIFKDYSKILNYSDRLNDIFSKLPFRQMSVSPKDYDYQFPNINGF